MPKKPHKWGFKFFSRNGTSGMMYEGVPDPNSEVQFEKTGYCGGDIVMRLIDNLPKQKSYKLVFDNYFNFIELLIKLKEQEIWDIGTLRADRMRQCKLKTEKELKKEGRGSFDGAIDLNSGVSIVRWYANKQVQLTSNFTHIQPVDTVTKWSRKDNKMIEISRPCIAGPHAA